MPPAGAVSLPLVVQLPCSARRAPSLYLSLAACVSSRLTSAWTSVEKLSAPTSGVSNCASCWRYLSSTRCWKAIRSLPAAVDEPLPSCLVSNRSEEHTSELQSLMRISYAVFCLKKKKNKIKHAYTDTKKSKNRKHIS